MFIRAKDGSLINLNACDDVRITECSPMVGLIADSSGLDTSYTVSTYGTKELAENALNSLCDAIADGKTYFSFK
jgi:hypothetical protein